MFLEGCLRKAEERGMFLLLFCVFFVCFVFFVSFSVSLYNLILPFFLLLSFFLPLFFLSLPLFPSFPLASRRRGEVIAYRPQERPKKSTIYPEICRFFADAGYPNIISLAVGSYLSSFPNDRRITSLVMSRNIS